MPLRCSGQPPGDILEVLGLVQLMRMADFQERVLLSVSVTQRNFAKAPGERFYLIAVLM